MSLTDELCGADAIGGKCCLPRGHNMGNLDIPSNHQAEVTKPQEPSSPGAFEEWYDTKFKNGFERGPNDKYVARKAWFAALYTTPQPCPKCAEGMVSVTKEDANNYCRILTLLGMEEEGSPVEGVERLISLREGMTCGDCNDTGWLENREEGRYPCTCMTEAEPYQILEAERDDWKSRYESNLSVNQMHSDNNAEMLKFNAKLLAKRDALAMQNKKLFGNLTIARGIVSDYAALTDGFRTELGFIDEALALPDTSEIIKRHDAAVLRKAAEHLEGYEYVFNAPPINYAEAHELRLMANELEKSCQP